MSFGRRDHRDHPADRHEAADGSDGPERARRTTRQRTAVLAELDRFDGFRTARATYDSLRRSGGSVGLATVYRILQDLADIGEVDVLRNESGEVSYRRCRTAHHHHLVCRHCGRTIEVQGPAIEAWVDEVAGRFGYGDVNHTLELFGTCAACR